MEEQLLSLLEDVRNEGDGTSRRALNALLREQPEARTIMARLLVNDTAFWKSVAGRLSSDELRIANQHLQRMGVRPLDLATGPVSRMAVSHDLGARLE